MNYVEMVSAFKEWFGFTKVFLVWAPNFGGDFTKATISEQF